MKLFEYDFMMKHKDRFVTFGAMFSFIIFSIMGRSVFNDYVSRADAFIDLHRILFAFMTFDLISFVIGILIRKVSHKIDTLFIQTHIKRLAELFLFQGLLFTGLTIGFYLYGISDLLVRIVSE